MKALENAIREYNEPKKKIIFKVLLGQKRHLDYNPKEYYQSQKKNKKLFILEKPQNFKNILNNKESNISNENNININVNNQNYKSSTKILLNYTPINTPITAETNNVQKLNEIKNTELNKIYNNNNNKNNNNNNNEAKNNNKQENNSKKQFGDYLCLNEDKIGSGSFGEVLYGFHRRTHGEVAVKILNSDTSQENIKREITYTKQLQGAQGFPSIYCCGSYDKKYIIVESLLGPSLDKLFKFCNRIFPLKTVCLIGVEMVKRLETMHQKGILHRDLKPNNLTWGNFNNSYNNISINNNINKNNYEKLDINTIYLIDFGLSCSYWENNLKKHYRMSQGLNFVGTLRYASLNSHKGIRQSRRDDLESMIYILIYFLKGKLPWQDVRAKNKEERYKLIQQIKTEVTIDSLCKEIPSEFAILLKYVKELKFDEKPDYNKFYNYFQNLINKCNSEQQTEEKNFNYIWEKKLVDYINDNNSRFLEEIQNIIFKGYTINLKNFANYIIYNNKILNENIRKKENIYIGDSTESMESNTNLK